MAFPKSMVLGLPSFLVLPDFAFWESLASEQEVDKQWKKDIIISRASLVQW